MNKQQIVIFGCIAIFFFNQLHGFADWRHHYDAQQRLANLKHTWNGNNAVGYKPKLEAKATKPEVVYLITGNGSLVKIRAEDMPEVQYLLTSSIDNNGQTTYSWKKVALPGEKDHAST